MRVAVLTNILTPYRMPFFEALAARAEQFSVLLMAQSHGNRSWTLPTASFPIEVLPGAHWTPRGWEEPLHLNYGVGRALRRLQPDVLLNGAYTPASLAAYLHCRLAGIHHVPWGELTLRDGSERSALRRWLRRTIIRGSSGCVASSSVSRDAFAHYGMTPERILCATMPVNTEFFATTATRLRAGMAAGRAAAGGPLLLAVGQLVDRKGFPELLDAMQILQQRWPQVSLVVAGDGPQRAEYERRAQQLGLRNLQFLGFVAPEALVQLYVKANAFVFPTRYDCFGAVVPEAMAAGAIVVASPHAAATRDLLVDGETGLIVAPDDPRELAAGIARAVELPAAAREAMSTRAATRACANSFASTADAVMQFLCALQPRPGARATRSQASGAAPRTST